MKDQDRAPLFEAIKRHRRNRVVPFDVPGHKGGRGNSELTGFLGADCLAADVNSMKPLDNLCHPVSVIKEASELAADAFGASAAFFMVNGTTEAVQAMIMYCCNEGDKIIMPRNVHRSAINALVICGAIPVYVNPGTDKKLGIPLGMSADAVREAVTANPGAKAILVNNPTYYGVCSNLEEIAKIAHDAGMLLLADEAHGTHFYFGEGLPPAAMREGADMAAVSMHKTGGSLTQSSLLLCGKDVDHDYMRQIVNITQTTSASYLLLSSLDITRRNLVKNGAAMFKKALEFAQYARDEINRSDCYYAFSKELCNGDTVFNFDATKLSIYTRDAGLAGIEVYDILRDDYNIQIEFGDIGNILAIISAGDRALEIERLISSLYEILRLHRRDPAGMLENEYFAPDVRMAPKAAFFSKKAMLPLSESAGRICGEFVMSYPPGIPVLAPGELVTSDIIEYIKYAKEKGCFLTGTKDMDQKYLNVVI